MKLIFTILLMLSFFSGFSQKTKKDDADVSKMSVRVEDYIKVRKENDSIVIIYSTVPYSLLVENKDTIQVRTNFYERRFTIKNYTFIIEE